jgi:putative solute:sodium symporter small subunit
MNSDQATHWRRTRSLMWVTLAIWFVFSFLVHWFADALNGASFLGFPLGFYMAAQGSLVVFVVLIFWFARTQDRIDRECGMAEDD